MRYRIPPVRVAHETLDGEVVILDQESGTYFSLDGAGAEIWEAIAVGVAADGVVAFCDATFELPEGAHAAIATLLERLVAERLVELVEGEGVTPPPPQGGKRPWTAPSLERFTDLQSLLLLDPIHDVDESGWPNVAP